jgi:hypothetical protein
MDPEYVRVESVDEDIDEGQRGAIDSLVRDISACRTALQTPERRAETYRRLSQEERDAKRVIDDMRRGMYQPIEVARFAESFREAYQTLDGLVREFGASPVPTLRNEVALRLRLHKANFSLYAKQCDAYLKDMSRDDAVPKPIVVENTNTVTIYR